jgi:hypothetical protein
VPWWFFLISGLICGVLASWLLTWQRRIRCGVIATGIPLSGAVLTVKPGELAGQWPNSAVLSPRLLVRYSWQGTATEETVVLRMSRSAKVYHPGQTVDLAIDPARPGRVVLADGGGQSVSAGGSVAMFAGIVVAALAISLLIRFLIAVF